MYNIASRAYNSGSEKEQIQAGFYVFRIKLGGKEEKMTKNIIKNKPEPAPGILKRSDLFAIAVGGVIGSGMVTLIGPAMAYT